MTELMILRTSQVNDTPFLLPRYYVNRFSNKLHGAYQAQARAERYNRGCAIATYGCGDWVR